jgi:hypothetical protein
MEADCVKDFISDAFARMNLRQLRSCLLYGTDEFDQNVQPYGETLSKSDEPINALLNRLCTDNAERDKAAEDLSRALTTHDYVYMELEMKAGARIVCQLLFESGEANSVVNNLPIDLADRKPEE